jgi:tetratricopeptide (TPR) repeat protein
MAKFYAASDHFHNKKSVLSWCFLVFIVTQSLSQAPSPQEQQYLFSVLPLIDKGQLREAEEKLLEGLKLYPRSAILSNALGIAYERQEKIDDAIAVYQNALKALPHFTAAQLHLALLYQRQDKKREAAELFNLAVSTTSDFEALSTAGLGLAQCEDYAGAVRALEKARLLRPDSVSVAYNLALAHFKSGDFHSARDALGTVPVRAGSEDVDLIFLRGQIKQALKEDGGEDMAQACRLSPGSEHFCTEAGLALIREERLQEAQTLLQAGLEKSESSPNLLSALGLAQFRLGKYAEAIRTYQRVLDKNPEADDAREGLAFLLYIAGNLSQARRVTEEGLKRPGSDFYLSQIHAMVLFRLSSEEWDEALVSVNRALEKNPQFAPSYFLRGKIAMERGQLEGALRDFERAAQLDSKYALPHYKIAQILLRLGKSAEADAARKKFFELGQMREEELLVRQTQDVLMRKASRQAE